MKELQRDFEVRYQHAQSTSMSRRDAHMEVDLHIHELVDDQRGLADGAKLAIQMAHFDRMMDIAKREKLRRIVFIHGVGQGVLRHQIRTALDQHHPDCNHREGDPRRYGSGATEVWLGQASWRKP
jgi:DNA-nicking Smr family endonuclease